LESTGFSIFLHFRQNEIQDFSGFAHLRESFPEAAAPREFTRGLRYFSGILTSFLNLHTISVFSP